MLVFNYVFTNVINLKLLGTECCDFFFKCSGGSTLCGWPSVVIRNF